MTGRTSRIASITSENTVEFDFPYAEPQHARLLLRSHPTYGHDVILQIERGQILCPSYENCRVRVRFDEDEPTGWVGVGPADNSTTSVFIRGYDRFLARLRRAHVVRIQVPVFQNGEPAFEFRVSGFDPAQYNPPRATR